MKEEKPDGYSSEDECGDNSNTGPHDRNSSKQSNTASHSPLAGIEAFGLQVRIEFCSERKRITVGGEAKTKLDIADFIDGITFTDTTIRTEDSGDATNQIKKQLLSEAVQHLLFYLNIHLKIDAKTYNPEKLPNIIGQYLPNIIGYIDGLEYGNATQADPFRPNIYAHARSAAAIISQQLCGLDAPTTLNYELLVDAEAESTACPIETYWQQPGMQVTFTQKSYQSAHANKSGNSAMTLIASKNDSGEAHISVRISYLKKMGQIDRSIRALDPESDCENHYYLCLMSPYALTPQHHLVGDLNNQSGKIEQIFHLAHSYNRRNMGHHDLSSPISKLFFPIVIGVNGYGQHLGGSLARGKRSDATHEAKVMDNIGILSILCDLKNRNLITLPERTQEDYSAIVAGYKNFLNTTTEGYLHQHTDYYPLIKTKTHKAKDDLKQFVQKDPTQMNPSASMTSSETFKSKIAQVLVRIYMDDEFYTKENGLLVQSLLHYLSPTNSTMFGCKSGNERMSLVLARSLILRKIEKSATPEFHQVLDDIINYTPSMPGNNRIYIRLNSLSAALTAEHKNDQLVSNTICLNDTAAPSGVSVLPMPPSKFPAKPYWDAQAGKTLALFTGQGTNCVPTPGKTSDGIVSKYAKGEQIHKAQAAAKNAAAKKAAKAQAAAKATAAPSPEQASATATLAEAEAAAPQIIPAATKAQSPASAAAKTVVDAVIKAATANQTAAAASRAEQAKQEQANKQSSTGNTTPSPSAH